MSTNSKFLQLPFAFRWFPLACAFVLSFGGSFGRADDAGPRLLGKSCYARFNEMFRELYVEDGQPYFLTSAGTEVTFSRAMEKEGLMYSDIAPWFDHVDPVAFRRRLQEKLNREKPGKNGHSLSVWLKHWLEDPSLREEHRNNLPDELQVDDPDPQKILDFILAQENPFEVISIEGREALFYDGFLSFDDLRSSDRTPVFLTVGNDLGSYEVRSVRGEADLKKYRAQRNLVEGRLEGFVGHQHLVHAWPEDAVTRKKMAASYIELLDDSTWYLFWRQAKRDPEEFESILTHPYLGVYNRAALERLYTAVVNGDVKAFNNKFRMVGSRNLKGDPLIPGQEGKILPDFELRSGNKTEYRGFIEDALTARITDGDYHGLQDFRTYDFDASAPLEQLVRGLVPASDMKALKKFEEKFKYLQWSPSKKAYNHFRNKFLAPLMPWENRLPLGTKAALVKDERKKFAQALVGLAKDYTATAQVSDNMHESVLRRLQALVFDFADKTRLDLDFKRQIMPSAEAIPEITVPVTGDVAVNDIPLGIEYTFRYPSPPDNRDQADRQIRAAAEAFKKAMGGGTIEKMDLGGHGHGLSVRYVYTDLQGRNWRFEWDGIRRSYRERTPYWSRRGHLEVPTPKFVPKDTRDIGTLFSAMGDLGNFPLRAAGGAHVNVDLEALQALPEKEGARKMANLIAYFESNRDIISALWQHPYRVRSGMPVELSQELIYRLNEFDGDWNGLSKLLYDSQYYNTYVTRKPAYTQFNLLALMADEIPEEYNESIDIKLPGQRWFPSFGGKGKDRVEFRLFDAPEDEYTAALQIKYMRALLNTTLNSSGKINLVRKFPDVQTEIWKHRPANMLSAAEDHLKDLHLDAKEFAPLLRQAVEIQFATPSAKPPLTKYLGFGRRLPEEEEEEEEDSGEHRLSDGALRARMTDVERQFKRLLERRNAFEKRPQGMEIVNYFDEFDWAVTRFEDALRHFSELSREDQDVLRGMKRTLDTVSGYTPADVKRIANAHLRRGYSNTFKRFFEAQKLYRRIAKKIPPSLQ